MVYVCHKVGLLFPLCESCETLDSLMDGIDYISST